MKKDVFKFLISILQKWKSNGYLDDNVSLTELSNLTKNYTGAEIEGLVRSATSFALSRQIDPKNPTKPIDPDKVTVSMEDFLNALDEVKPAFGVSEGKLDESIKNGIIPYSEEFEQLYNTGKEFIDQIKNSTRIQVLSVLLSGVPGSGKTALACKLALEGEFPLVRLLSPEDFVGYSEQAKVQKISKAFYDAYKSPISCIILDDIERFLEYVPLGNRFSNQVLQTLLVLFKEQPPKNHRLFIIGTTSRENVLVEMGFLDSISMKLDLPLVRGPDQIKKVLDQLNFAMNDYNFDMSTEIPIKKLILYAERSSFGVEGSYTSRLEKFLENHNNEKDRYL